MERELPWWAVRPDSDGAQPARVKKWTLRSLVAPVAVAAALTIGLGTAAADRPYPPTRPVPHGGWENSQTVDELANGCSGVARYPEQPSTRVIPDGTHGHGYATRPPSFGEHWATHSLADGPLEYPKPGELAREEALAAQKDGWLVIWYDPERVPDASLAAARQFTEEQSATGRKVVLAAWDAEEWRSFPAERALAFAGWGTGQTCIRFSGFLAANFPLTAD